MGNKHGKTYGKMIKHIDFYHQWYGASGGCFCMILMAPEVEPGSPIKPPTSGLDLSFCSFSVFIKEIRFSLFHLSGWSVIKSGKWPDSRFPPYTSEMGVGIGIHREYFMNFHDIDELTLLPSSPQHFLMDPFQIHQPWRLRRFAPACPVERRVEVCAAYLQIAAFRQYARDRRFLAQQLQSFSVQHALCRVAAATPLTQRVWRTKRTGNQRQRWKIIWLMHVNNRAYRIL